MALAVTWSAVEIVLRNCNYQSICEPSEGMKTQLMFDGTMASLSCNQTFKMLNTPLYLPNSTSCNKGREREREKDRGRGEKREGAGGREKMREREGERERERQTDRQTDREREKERERERERDRETERQRTHAHKPLLSSLVAKLHDHSQPNIVLQSTTSKTLFPDGGRFVP